jgi:hypothetical protein
MAAADLLAPCAAPYQGLRLLNGQIPGLKPADEVVTAHFMGLTTTTENGHREP